MKYFIGFAIPAAFVSLVAYMAYHEHLVRFEPSYFIMLWYLFRRQFLFIGWIWWCITCM